jgi:hypothetical protein
MVPRNHIDRRRKRFKQGEQVLIFLGLSPIREVSGHHNRIREWREPFNMGDAPLQVRSGVDAPICQLSRRTDVQIA